MELKNPAGFGYSVGVLSEKLQRLQVMYSASPADIATNYMDKLKLTKVILDSMQPHVGFLAEQCGWSRTYTNDDDSSDGASA